MKNSSTKLIKSFVIAGAVFALAVSPTFAKGNAPSRNRGGVASESQGKNSGKMNREMPGKNPERPNCDMQGFSGMGMMRGGKRGMNIAVMGTVKSVDSGKSTVTVIDADGKDVVVHVNPNTRICSVDRTDEGMKEETIARGNKTVTVKRPETKVLEISEVKQGDWVQVSKFNTETTVLEAANIMIVK